MLPEAPSANAPLRNDLLQAGLDLLDQGITVFDGDLRLVAWNRTFLQLLEFPDALAYVGAPFENFIRYNAERGEYGPGDREIQIAERVAAARNFSQHVTERQRPNGRVLLLRGEPLPDRGFVTLYSDVTEQRYIEHLTEHQNIQLDERVRRRTAQLENANANLRRANEENERIAAALGRSEARLRLINDTIPILIGYVDQNEVYQYANKGYSDWYGHPEGGVTGRAVLDVIGPAVYGQVRDSVRRALSGQQVTYEYQMQRQGQTVFAQSTLVPETTAEGKTLGFFVFSHEITEQKRMQAALVQAQKMEAIGQLTGGLATTSTTCSPSSSATSPPCRTTDRTTPGSMNSSNPPCSLRVVASSSSSACSPSPASSRWSRRQSISANSSAAWPSWFAAHCPNRLPYRPI